jgi:hypothetical protein
MNDHEAMLAIQQELDGEEWTADTLECIAEIYSRLDTASGTWTTGNQGRRHPRRSARSERTD